MWGAQEQDTCVTPSPPRSHLPNGGRAKEWPQQSAKETNAGQYSGQQWGGEGRREQDTFHTPSPPRSHLPDGGGRPDLHPQEPDIRLEEELELPPWRDPDQPLGLPVPAGAAGTGLPPPMSRQGARRRKARRGKARQGETKRGGPRQGKALKGAEIVRKSVGKALQGAEGL